MLRLLIAALALLTSVAATRAEPPRFALVIGTGPEGKVAAAASANAGMVAVALRDAGFDVENRDALDAAGLRRAVREFTARVEAARGEAYAVLYLGGPVLQGGGRNFLLARASDISRASDVPIEGVAIGDLLSAVATAPAKGWLVITDAMRGPTIPGVEPGLAPLAPAKGTFVAMSAAPGEVLPDGEAAARFSETLAEALTSGPWDVEAVFERVHNQVGSKSGGAQSPTRLGALIEPFPLGSKASKPGPASTAQARAASADPSPPIDAPADPAHAEVAATSPAPAGPPADGPVATGSIGTPAAPPPASAAPTAPAASAAVPAQPADGVPVPQAKPDPGPRVATVQPPPGPDPASPGQPGEAPPTAPSPRLSAEGQPGLPPLSVDYLAGLRPREAYRLVRQYGTAQAYNAFLQAFPTHTLAVEVRGRLAQQQDAAAWRRAVSAGTSAAYRTYLRSFPSGQYRSLAETRLGLPAAQARPDSVPPRPLTPSPFGNRGYGDQSGMWR